MILSLQSCAQYIAKSNVPAKFTFEDISENARFVAVHSVHFAAANIFSCNCQIVAVTRNNDAEEGRALLPVLVGTATFPHLQSPAEGQLLVA